MADVEAKVIKQCKQSGQPLPEKIQNAPEIELGLEVYWDAFLDLNTCRGIGMGSGPIPWTAILQYAEEHGFVGDQREALFHHVRSMDATFQRYNNAKEK